jgi:hypothetical protein
MCSQGRLRAEEGTLGGVMSEWHDVQVEHVQVLEGVRLPGTWPLRNMAKIAASAGATCRYICRQIGEDLCVLQAKLKGPWGAGEDSGAEGKTKMVGVYPKCQCITLQFNALKST